MTNQTRDRVPAKAKSNKSSEPPAPHPVSKSLREYARGIAGGLIFSLPLLYTMEMWWAGFMSNPLHKIFYIAITFVLLLGYNRFAGLRKDSSFTEVLIDSVEELGIGLVLSAAILFLLGQLTRETTLDEGLGKIVFEAMTVAIGVSVGTAQLGGKDEENDAGMAADSEAEANTFHGQLILAFCGAILFAANIAPTEEIVMIAARAGPLKLLALAIGSMAIATMILHYSNFRSADTFSRADDLFAAIRGTLTMYATALVCSAMILFFFGRFADTSVVFSVSETVVLAFPATMGASAGRLLLQS